MTGPAIARQLGRPLAIVGLALCRHGLGRLAAFDPRPPIVRYPRDNPGEPSHVDTKKLGRIGGIGHRITGQRAGVVRNRGIGWEHLHVAVCDASRLTATCPPAGRSDRGPELLPDERKESATALLSRALAWLARHGVIVGRVMTDNGSAHRSRDVATAVAGAGRRHIRTRPYTPRTNGQAERFIRSSLREWAHARQTSAERGAAMPPWIASDNHRRPHAAVAGQPPSSRSAGDNVLGDDS